MTNTPIQMRGGSQVIEIYIWQRFGFGLNWGHSLSEGDEARIANAEASLKRIPGLSGLRGGTFLDEGSGSGLLDLAVRPPGARFEVARPEALLRSIAITASHSTR